MVYLQIDLNGNQLHIYKPLYTVHIQLALPISLKDTDIAKKFKSYELWTAPPFALLFLNCK